MRGLILLLTIAGLIATAVVVASVGVGPVLAAVARIGPGGFVVFCLYQFAVVGVLGLAWRAVAPESGARWRDFAWARLVRDAATDVLPFAQIGGLVVGARVLTARSVAAPLVWASMIADLTTEMAAQLVFTLFGIGLLLVILNSTSDGGEVLGLVLGGLGLSFVLLAAFTFGQRPMLALAVRLGERVLPKSVAALAGVRATLAAIYRRPGGLAWSFAANLLAWAGSAAGAWLALRLMGVEIGLDSVLAIEALVFAVRTIAFVVPGALGIQEGAYLLLAPLFGLDPQVAVALSLLKRARDLTIGVPVILLWQAGEGRRLLA